MMMLVVVDTTTTTTMMIIMTTMIMMMMMMNHGRSVVDRWFEHSPNIGCSPEKYSGGVECVAVLYVVARVQTIQRTWRKVARCRVVYYLFSNHERYDYGVVGNWWLYWWCSTTRPPFQLYYCTATVLQHGWGRRRELFYLMKVRDIYILIIPVPLSLPYMPYMLWLLLL